MSTVKTLKSIDEAITEAGWSRSSMYKFLKEGSLKAVKVGRRTFIKSDDLRNFIENLPQYKTT